MVYHVQFPGLGLDLTVNRVALAIGGFNIYWYGVIIAAGMLLAMLYAFRNAVAVSYTHLTLPTIA